MILCGDPLQLQAFTTQKPGQSSQVIKQFFESRLVQRYFEILTLSQVFRQREEQDELLRKLLTDLRVGQYDAAKWQETAATFGTATRKLEADMNTDGGWSKVLHLYPKNEFVANHNSLSLQRFVKEKKITIQDIEAEQRRVAVAAAAAAAAAAAVAAVDTDAEHEQLQLPSVLRLALGVPVMILVNSRVGGYSNGTRGVVKQFKLQGKIVAGVVVEVVKEGGIKKELTVSRVSCRLDRGVDGYQFPLALAFALTVHKCQGQEAEYLHVHPKDMFTESQLYVALSRIQSSAGLLVDMDDLKLVNRKATKPLDAALKFVNGIEALKENRQAESKREKQDNIRFIDLTALQAHTKISKKSSK